MNRISAVFPEIPETRFLIASLTPADVITAEKEPPAPVIRNTIPAECRALAADASAFLRPIVFIAMIIDTRVPQSMDVVFCPRNVSHAGVLPTAPTIVFRRIRTIGMIIGSKDTPKLGSFSGNSSSSTFSPLPFSSVSAFQRPFFMSMP